MHHLEEAPRLNPWPFIIGDILLLATAYLIGSQSPAPLSSGPLLAIVSCVGLGAILATLPFLLNHTRQQEQQLAERQRELAALAQTTATTAEQISIAASSLHSLAEGTARAVKLGEQLPQKMQEKINDFKTQLNEVAVTENESLAQEINTLRSSETERLEAALTGVRKAAADLAMLEAVSRKHIGELSEQLSRFTASAQSSASESTRNIEAARSAAEKSLAAGQQAAIAALKDAVTSALGDIERRFTELSSRLARQAARSAPAVQPAPAKAAPAGEDVAPAAPARPVVVERSLQVGPRAGAVVAEPAPAPASEATPPAGAPVTESPVAAAIAAAAIAEFEPAAVTVVEVKPAVPSAVPAAAVAPSPVPVPGGTAAPLNGDKPARKRAPRKTAPAEQELALGIEFEPAGEYSQIAPDESAPAVSADGLTRLLVTAYIGIGNKLFVRGEGPGLSWDRGVPLQFVSIGKWRWETADAASPVTLKILKNDEQECSALGAVTLSPGHQQEVRANFS